MILLTLLFNSNQLRSSLKPFSLINVSALLLLFFVIKFSAKFNLDLGKKKFL